MGWEGDHLHLFDISGRRYGDPLAVDGVTDEERLTLNGGEIGRCPLRRRL